MADKLALKSFRLKNFKAVRDSGTVHFTPLTVFIGDNGSGKSSFIEGLQTYQRIVTDGLDAAMGMWRGFENVRNAAASYKSTVVTEGRSYLAEPIEFRVRQRVVYSNVLSKDESQFHLMSASSSPNGDEIFIFEELLHFGGKKNLSRNKEGIIFAPDGKRFGYGPVLTGDQSFLNDLRHSASGYRDVYNLIDSWQFVMLDPYSMGNPRPQQRAGGSIRLESEGSNIAEYLLDIYQLDQNAFEGILESLQYVLPYARDLQPTLTSELERTVYLRMTEEDFKVPGWLLSTGTLRILALLALFRHPKPPPLIIIEEIENGLDPRTIHLIVDELRYLVETGRTQVIVTTHSPYLLDLLALSQIMLVERMNGEPAFYRPADEESLGEWAKNFGPGHLYTMDKLTRRGRS